MTRADDRRNHADALRKHHLSTQGARLKRQALVMLASVALGGLALPNIMLGRDAMLATGTYYWAKAKLWAVSGWEADTGIDVHYHDHVEEGRSARQIIAHPYFRRRVDLVWSWARWGSALGFGSWLVMLIALRGAMARRREGLPAFQTGRLVVVASVSGISMILRWPDWPSEERSPAQRRGRSSGAWRPNQGV